MRSDLRNANLKTKSIEKFKSINTKTINYTMEFEMAYDIINSIVKDINTAYNSNMLSFQDQEDQT